MAFFAPLIPLAIKLVAGGAAAYAAKKTYDAATSSSSSDYDADDYSDNSAQRESEARQREAEQRRQQRAQRQQQQASQMISGELQQIRQDYLEPVTLPTGFDADAIQAFLDCDVDDKKSLEKALGTLCGKPVRMREREDSRVKALQTEMHALKKLEQFVREV